MPPQSNRPWTAEDDRQLIELRAAGRTFFFFSREAQANAKSDLQPAFCANLFKNPMIPRRGTSEPLDRSYSESHTRIPKLGIAGTNGLMWT
jgi:hypothetical protein